jgi:manganese-dependent inorganic pyrophosphatase
VSTIYVTGHRNPDADSIASAIGYAELRRRLHPDDEYVPVRLGECNAQTRWLLERSGAPEPRFLPHVMLRVCDVMQSDFPVGREDQPIRDAGLAMVRADLELLPIVDHEGALLGVVTDRALAQRYVRESRHTSTLKDAPTSLGAIADALDGRVLTGEDKQLAGRVWVQAMEVGSPTGISEGDVVVVGNREDAQRLAIERGAALLVTSNSTEPSAEILELARARGTAVIVSALDSYVSGRMITLAAPCRAFVEGDPLTVTTEYLVSDASEQIKDVHYGGAVVVDAQRRPVGLLTRSDLVAPPRRRVLLVDHAEQAQSVNGVEHAEIVEILDHHHIGSIETRVPVTATFDPVGSTATLVVERFRQNGLEPSRATATMTQRDHAVVEYLERVLVVDAHELGREMFEATSDVSEVPAEEIVARDAKQYQAQSGGTICIAQVEVVGRGLLERKAELLSAMKQARANRGVELYVLMVTDVLAKGTELLVAGDAPAVARSLGVSADDSVIELPGVMSRKKQVAPKLLASL